MDSTHNPDKKAAELRCPKCYSRDIVLSMPRGLKDLIMRGMARAPRHCRFCGKRFYVKDASLAAAAGEEPPDE